MVMNIFSPITKALSALRVKPANPDDRGGTVNVLMANNAKVRVTHENAIEVSAVWACMDIIASSLSATDWNVYQGVRGSDNTTAIPQDVLHYILNTRMNAEMTAQAGKRALLLAAVGYGNGYAEIERDLAGRIVALWPISPDRVEVRRPLEGGPLFYRVTQDYTGGTVDMDASDIFHLRGAGLLGFVGDSVLLRAVQTIAQALATDAFASGYFGNNTQLGTVFIYKGGKLDDSHYGRLKESIEERHKGSAKAFRSAIFDGGDWDVKQIGTTADKAQMIEAKQQVIEDICRYFHVPPHKVQHLLRATNNNIEHQGLEFTRDTLRPWVKEIEQESDYKLIPARGQRRFVTLDLDWAEQGDYKSRAEAFQIYRNMGVFSANDVLRKLGENTIGEAGDIRIVQGANVRLEDVGIAYTNGTQAPDPEDTPRTDDDAAQASASKRRVIMIKAALPPSYREGGDAVKRCQHCEYFKADLSFCERWEEVVQSTQVCDGWELQEDEDTKARKRFTVRAELPGSYRESGDAARRCEYCDYFKPDMANLCERWGNAVAPASVCDAWEAKEDDEEGPNVNVDVTVENWLTSVYSRIERRVENRREQLFKTDPENALNRARASCSEHAAEAVAELKDVLGDKYQNALKWANEVVNGLDPKTAAKAALE